MKGQNIKLDEEEFNVLDVLSEDTDLQPWQSLQGIAQTSTQGASWDERK